MIDFSKTVLRNTIVHKVGQRSENQGVQLSNACIPNDNTMLNALLKQYFLKPFQNPDRLYNFYHPLGIDEHPMYGMSKEIFDDFEGMQILNTSAKMAEWLYTVSENNQIPGGDFFVSLIDEIAIEGQNARGIAILKTESKQTYLSVQEQAEVNMIYTHEGINPDKIDKAALIIEAEEEKGYIVIVRDLKRQTGEAVYWKENFLQLEERNDQHKHTHSYLDLCKNFVQEEYALNEEIAPDRADTIDLLNRSIDYFKENSVFREDSFKRDVLKTPDVQEAFDGYKQEYSEGQEEPIQTSFHISPEAVKKNQKFYKSVLKLDKNFHVYIHGNRDYIQKGFDDSSNLHFYQIFFEKEL